MSVNDLIEQEKQLQDKLKNEVRNKFQAVRASAVKTEGEFFLEVLRLTDFNKSKAAELLGMDRKTFYSKLNQYNTLLNDTSKILASGV